MAVTAAAASTPPSDLCACSNLTSNSMIFFCNLTTDIHFFASSPFAQGSALTMPASCLNISADWVKTSDWEDR